MFNSQGTVITVSVGPLAAIALALGISYYVEWSSDAAWNEFQSASVSNPHQSTSQGKSCAQGKRKLPNQITPLP
jgi:hypothetical protein